MIDFHCHVDLFPDPRKLVAEITRRHCYVLAVTTTPLAWEGTLSVVGNAPRIRVALGLHPELVAERHKEVEQFRRLLPQARYVGEIGIDGSARHRASRELQKRVFRTLLRAIAEAGGRVMSIHSRSAAGDVLDALEEHQDAGTPVLHWFTGTQSELRRAREMGCWFSVGPAMLKTQKGRRLLAEMPRDRVLTESDGPFGRVGGTPVSPWALDTAVQAISETWDQTPEAVQAGLRANLKLLTQSQRAEGAPPTERRSRRSR